MKLLRATQFASVVYFAVAMLLGFGSAQTVPDQPAAATSVVTGSQGSAANLPSRAFPHIQLWNNEALTYLGMFRPDAVYRSTSKRTSSTGYSPGEGIEPAPLRNQNVQHTDVPASMLLLNERVVENLEPPAHAEAVAHAPSRIAETRNRFITYAYGRPSVLHAPRHIATDSQQRLIISDPDGDTVHVLDPGGRTSFRIVAGKGRRLLQPAGVAVDAKDNIYIADSARGMVLVFDRYGSFLRYIGNFQGESQYESPHGIAIDRKAGHIYLVDSPRNLIFMLDLTGKLVKRVGKYRDGTGVGEFNDPTDIAVSQDHVYVLDSSGTRVQTMDSDCTLRATFSVPRVLNPQVNRENGLGADQQGNVYVSSFNGSLIRVFTQDGRLLASFGQPGQRVGEFAGPDGLWIDSANRLYVADSGNGRVQLFQLGARAIGEGLRPAEKNVEQQIPRRLKPAQFLTIEVVRRSTKLRPFPTLTIPMCSTLSKTSAHAAAF